MKQAIEHLAQSTGSLVRRLSRKSITGRIATLLALILTAACASLQVPDVNSGARAAQQLSERGDHQAAIRQYLDLAVHASGTDKQRYMILAARELYLANDMDRAGNILDKAEGSVEAINLNLWVLVAATVRLARGQPESALDALDQIDALDAQLLLLKAQALFPLGRPEEGVLTLLEREARLTTPIEIKENQRSIWNGLKGSGATLPLATAAFSDNPLVDGWLELGYLHHSGRNKPAKLKQNLEAWRLLHPLHPASDVLLQEVLDNLDALMNYPRQIALLLPLTGGKRPEAEAIREGFLAAHFGLQGLPARPEISIYDTGRLSPVEAYRRAILNGTDFVVGPLFKESVTAIAAEARQITTLALNFLPNNRETPRGFYQFALWSEDEARQAAERAVAEGRSRAVALAADNDWGRRMLGSFAAELESSDGQLLDSALYDVSSADFSSALQRAIRGLLLLDESFARHERLTVNLGQKLNFEPRRREDVDFIFIAATAKNGIRIRPQLKYEGAGSIPTYATSRIFEVESTNNSDLDGIMFPDIPWLIEPNPTARELQQTLAQYWAGQANRHSRFYAMGYDTYRLIPFLNGEVRSGLEPLAGMTGQLHMDDNRRIHRTLTWARIERGQLLPLPDLPAPLAGEIQLR